MLNVYFIPEYLALLEQLDRQLIERLCDLQVLLPELGFRTGKVRDGARHLETAVDGVVALGVPHAGAVRGEVGAERAAVVVADHGLGEGHQSQRRAAAHVVAPLGFTQGGRGDDGVAGENVAGPRHRPQHVEVLDLVEGFGGAGGVGLVAADGREVTAPAQVSLVRHESGLKEVALPDKELDEADVALDASPE